MLNFEHYREIKQIIEELIKYGFHIPRSQMPQIFGDLTNSFLEFLDYEGVSYENVMIPTKDLKVTQGEIDIEKIIPFINDGLIIKKDKPILTSKDGYVLDGHHRFVAMYIIDKNKKVPIITVDLPIVKLIELTRQFDKVSYKKLEE